jgi:hypothetical protein
MPSDGEFLSSICVGKLIPNIAEKFPNTTTKFVLLPHELPETRFIEGFSSMDVRSEFLNYLEIRHRKNEHKTKQTKLPICLFLSLQPINKKHNKLHSLSYTTNK